MHDDLVKRLRDISNSYSNIKSNYIGLTMTQAADAIEELSKPQSTVHLCESCKYQYPECPADTGVVFGRGKGNDNICQCADYVARIPRWIPVTERLPENDGRYLVCNQPYKAQWVMIQEYWKDSGWSGSSVTHWMPLPEPPKEEA